MHACEAQVFEIQETQMKVLEEEAETVVNTDYLVPRKLQGLVRKEILLLHFIFCGISLC